MSTEIVQADNGRAIVEAAPMRLNWSSIRNLAEAIQIAELVAKSNSFPKVRNSGQALVLMLAGAEMGFGPFASLVGVHMIQGVPTVGAHLKAAAIRQSGRYDYENLTPPGQDRVRCDLEFFRVEGGKRHPMKGGKISVLLSEIPTGLTRKDNWINHPDDMLFATAINKGYRRCCPDLTGGVLTYDEGEIEDARPQLEAPRNGEVVDASYTVSEPGKPDVVVSDSPDPVPVKPKTATDEQKTAWDKLVRQGNFPIERLHVLLSAIHPGAVTLDQLDPSEADRAIRQLEKKLLPAPATV